MPKKPVKRAPPFAFALESLESALPYTKPMFGCTAIYVGEKIVLILREKQDSDSGVWIATTHEHHESLSRDFPSMRSISISIFGPKATGWQNLPSDAADFEEAVLKACELVLAGDQRIGKIPKAKKVKAKARPRRR